MPEAEGSGQEFQAKDVDLSSPETPAETLEQRTRVAYDEGTSNYWAGFGRPGHEREYTVHVKGHDHDNYIPYGTEKAIQGALGEDWGVSNRGSRIEVVYYGDEEGVGSGQPNDALVEPILERVFNHKEPSGD